jgi:hypothetical protein
MPGVAVSGGNAQVSPAEHRADRASSIAAGLNAETTSARGSDGAPLAQQRSSTRDAMPLGPSPGAQAIKEVFAEDVVASRIANGRPVKTLPEGEDQSN